MAVIRRDFCWSSLLGGNLVAMLGTAQQQTIAYSKPPPLRPVRVRRVRKVNKESAPKPAAPQNNTEEQVPQLVIDVPAQREEVGRGC